MVMSDDDDAEPHVSVLEDYYLHDSAHKLTCFSTLPLWLGDNSVGADVPEPKKRLVLWGAADKITIYKEVVAWRLVLEGSKQPEIAVATADGAGWIRLIKPRKSYDDTVRSVMITAQMLHFLRRKPDEPEKNLWSHLRKVFDKFDVRPSVDDFRNHLSMMKQFAEKDPVLAKSGILRVFVEGKSRENTNEVGADNIEIKQPFITDDDDIDQMVNEDSSNESDEEEDEDLFDSICAICDNGGDLLCCDGPCMRSFHAKVGTGEDSYCDTLGYSEAEVEAMKIFLCKNCEYKKHQCFTCGALEPSDGAAAKVFLCNNATCGHFYHPKCVAQQLHPKNSNEASELEKKITNGFSFTCPIHWCFHCNGLEDRTQAPLQFAVCRRCPKSYHRKCLPREISFEDIEEEGIITRAWELSKRILIYCLEHEIDSDIETPIRYHIKFPPLEIEKPARALKKRMLLVKKKKKPSNELIHDQPSKKHVKMTGKDSLEEGKQTMRKTAVQGLPKNLCEAPDKKKIKFLKEKLEPYMSNDASLCSPKLAEEQGQELVSLISSTTRKIPLSSFPTVDSEAEKRVIALLGKEVSSLTLKDISRKCIVPSTHVNSGRQIERVIAQGKLERSVQALGAALKNLENGGNVNDAKAVCEPEVLRQLARWHSKLRVYISPFIHGTRYSSFGRHFTKVEKLVEIVDKLHCYVEPGDMIVDFCCGANDFSRLMKEKLDQVKKKCRFKNYDLIQPQNHFCFEKRDWMTVQPNELPCGSQLIMGLNPPFGVKASLANKFIDKALTFKPKLIILIVPKETKRLDQKKTPYDLIWEDSECLAGKAFYLPGSVDVNDKTLDGWNASAPPLYLWSHPDWTKKHMKLAEEHNHSCTGKIDCQVKGYALHDLPLREEAEPSDDKVNARSGKQKENKRKTSYHPKEDNASDDLPVKKQAKATIKWNSRSGKEGETKIACNTRDANVMDGHPAKKQARSEENVDLAKIAAHLKDAKISDILPVKKATEAASKVLFQSGKEKENDGRKSGKRSRKSTPDKVEYLPPEKQVEVAYEETKVIIPSEKSTRSEKRGSRHEDRNARGDGYKNAQHNSERRAAGMLNTKFCDGGDSDMNISSPDSRNAPSKSRSYSPTIPTGPSSYRTVNLDSCRSFRTKEPYDSIFNNATYQGTHLSSNDEYFDALKKKGDPIFYADINDNSRTSGSSIEDVTKWYVATPTSDTYCLQSKRNDGPLYTTASDRSLVADEPMLGHGIRYGGQVSDSYLQGSMIPLTTDSQTQLRMPGGTSADDYLSGRYSFVSSGARFSQPASTTTLGLSDAGASRGSVMDRYAYGLSGPSGSQSSVMAKYTPPLDGTLETRPNSLPRQYPFGRPGSSGGGWPAS